MADDVSSTVRALLSRRMPRDLQAQIEAVTGPLSEAEANLLTASMAGMVGAAINGNVSAFNALVELAAYDAPAAPVEQPRTPAATVLQMVRDERKAANG